MVFLRLAIDNDLELILAWRNSPLVYQGFYTQKEPIKFEDHYLWWRTRENFKVWIIRYGEGRYERDVGVVALQHLNTPCPEIGFYIGETTLWNKGIATEATRLALEWLTANGYKCVDTTIRDDNLAAFRVVEKLGFVHCGKAREGELGFKKDLTL